MNGIDGNNVNSHQRKYWKKRIQEIKTMEDSNTINTTAIAHNHNFDTYWGGTPDVLRIPTGDVLRLAFAFIGFSLPLAGSAFQNYANLMAVIVPKSTDLLGWIGRLDEGIDAVLLFGWTVCNAAHR